MKLGLWRHRNFLDVDFWFVVVNHGEEFVRVEGFWVNQNNRDITYGFDEIKIKRKELKNWRHLSE